MLPFTSVPPQPNNPTDMERYAMARYALAEVGRPEDFEFIVNLLSPPADITTIAHPGEFKGVRVGIIGGGLAGLSAAFELRKLGFDITVFEAMPDRIGGRVFTCYFDRQNLLYGEFGAMRIPVTHEAVWHYLKLFKLPTRPFIQKNENALIYLQDVTVQNDSGGKNVMQYIYPHYDLNPWERQTPWQQLLYLGIDSHLLNANPLVRSEILQVKKDYHPIIQFWDANNNRQMLERAGLSQDAINMLSHLSPLMGANLYNSYIDIAQANYSVNLAFLYEIPGGTSTLPYAFYQSFFDPYPQPLYPNIPVQILGKVSLRAGHWVTGVYRDKKAGKVTLVYRNMFLNHDQQEQFDYIVCANPLSTLRTMDIQPLFSNRKMQAIQEVNYSHSQKTLFLCKRRFWEEGGPGKQIIGGGSYTDLPIAQIWYPSDHAQYCCRKQKSIPYSHPSNRVIEPESMNGTLAGQPGVFIASYNYNLDTVRLANLPENIRVEKIKSEVERVHGLPKGYLDSIVIAAKTVYWDREPTIRGALPFFAEEQKRLFSYAMAEPEYDNRVFFAGDYVSAVHRWMQGALQSGMKAANGIARECTRRRG